METEHQIQCSFFEWVRVKELTDDRYKMIYAVPNGGARSRHVGGQIKREGGRRGMWDINVDVPVGGCPGLRVETKRPGGYLSKEQKEVGRMFRRFGYRLAVCTSLDEFIRTVEGYFRGEL